MDAFTLVGQLLAGWLIADFLGGLFHWWEDRVGNVDMPILGKLVIVPNRHHHLEPLAQSALGDWRNRIIVWIIGLIVAAAWCTVIGFSWVLVGMLAGALLVNEVHGWAHSPTKAPVLVRLLQDTGIFQSPQMHARHHRGSFDRCYCILTNWVNPWLDQVHFWDTLEYVLGRAGLEPNRGTA